MMNAQPDRAGLDPATADAAAGSASPSPGPARLRRLALMLSLPLLIAAGGLYLWMTSGRSVSTDNAYVQQNKLSVSAEVGGTIIEVAVRENQRVNVGDLLFRIDPEPYRIALAQADAEIAAAEARVSTLAITAGTMDADIRTARDAVRFAQNNLDRERALMERGFNTRARLDAAEARLSEANGRLADARMAAIRAEAQLATGQSRPGINPGLLAARVRRDQALRNLRLTEVRAPVAGIVSQSDRLLVGQTMVTGLPALSIVSGDTSWIEANFKETDLNRMRVGQRATITVDAYGDMELAGRVASIGAGTGSEFSILPAQNATGNWVKVTQRIPVRIAIDGRPPRPLIAGMSTHVRVHFDDR